MDQKIYIMIFGIANLVAGGPIYNRNKIRYLEERGWTVVVFPVNSGRVYIQGLEKYNEQCFRFFADRPCSYTPKQQEWIIKRAIEVIPKSRRETIIETGTDYTAYWGEMLAKRLNAKHFVMFLDEKNPCVTTRELPFFKFKYERHELACISSRAMVKLFENYMPITENEAYGLSACCSNVVEDYKSEIEKQIKKCKYNIGSIGRLDKPFSNSIIDGICTFADSVPQESVGVCLFGGADENTIRRIKDKLQLHRNVVMYITGYLFPLPHKALKKMDVFVSGAGSASVSARVGVPTVKVDMYDYGPAGVIVDVENQVFHRFENCPTIKDYLEKLLIEKKIPTIIENGYEYEWERICVKFDEHMAFIDKSSSTKEYFETNALGRTSKDMIKKCSRMLLGLKGYEYLLDEFKKNIW